MAGWTEDARRDGRAYATRILKELIDVRHGGDPVGARLLIDDAALLEAVGTIAQSLAMAESLLHRLAELTEETEEQVLDELLSEIGHREGEPAAVTAATTGRFARRARRTARSA